ncbi:hypothetical protein GCM10029976_078710 [Kribbella albertanoniae]|uniref:hypothetical protein n=1 Tax=Kribbella albertanoniae TaxID=1266829 RepID=UPI0014054413|nr:hypothetical protein [Kribbella albertanoniae]
MSDDADRLGELLAELAKVHGPVTEDELARARAEWPEGWSGSREPIARVFR